MSRSSHASSELAEIFAIFGPTATGKTSVAIELARLLRERGADPVAISCDALQIYRGIEVLTGAPTPAEQAALEHRLVGIAEVEEEFSAGRFAELAREEIDAALEAGRIPIVVGGTGLYMRAALTDLELRPPVPAEVRAAVEAAIAKRGPEALHAELPAELASDVHPNDRKRVARLTELVRAGIDPPPQDGGELWSARMRYPTLCFGLVCSDEELRTRIDARVEAMVGAGAPEEVRAALEAGASRTARAAIGFEELLAGDIAAMKAAQRRYAKRQMTWLRKMPGIEVIDRTGRSDPDLAASMLAQPRPTGA